MEKSTQLENLDNNNLILRSYYVDNTNKLDITSCEDKFLSKTYNFKSYINKLITNARTIAQERGNCHFDIYLQKNTQGSYVLDISLNNENLIFNDTWLVNLKDERDGVIGEIIYSQGIYTIQMFAEIPLTIKAHNLKFDINALIIENRQGSITFESSMNIEDIIYVNVKNCLTSENITLQAYDFIGDIKEIFFNKAKIVTHSSIFEVGQTLLNNGLLSNKKDLLIKAEEFINKAQLEVKGDLLAIVYSFVNRQLGSITVGSQQWVHTTEYEDYGRTSNDKTIIIEADSKIVLDNQQEAYQASFKSKGNLTIKTKANLNIAHLELIANDLLENYGKTTVKNVASFVAKKLIHLDAASKIVGDGNIIFTADNIYVDSYISTYQQLSFTANEEIFFNPKCKVVAESVNLNAFYASLDGAISVDDTLRLDIVQKLHIRKSARLLSIHSIIVNTNDLQHKGYLITDNYLSINVTNQAKVEPHSKIETVQSLMFNTNQLQCSGTLRSANQIIIEAEEGLVINKHGALIADSKIELLKAKHLKIKGFVESDEIVIDTISGKCFVEGKVVGKIALDIRTNLLKHTGELEANQKANFLINNFYLCKGGTIKGLSKTAVLKISAHKLFSVGKIQSNGQATFEIQDKFIIEKNSSWEFLSDFSLKSGSGKVYGQIKLHAPALFDIKNALRLYKNAELLSTSSVVMLSDNFFNGAKIIAQAIDIKVNKVCVNGFSELNTDPKKFGAQLSAQSITVIATIFSNLASLINTSQLTVACLLDINMGLILGSVYKDRILGCDCSIELPNPNELLKIKTIQQAIRDVNFSALKKNLLTRQNFFTAMSIAKILFPQFMSVINLVSSCINISMNINQLSKSIQNLNSFQMRDLIPLIVSGKNSVLQATQLSQSIDSISKMDHSSNEIISPLQNLDSNTTKKLGLSVASVLAPSNTTNSAFSITGFGCKISGTIHELDGIKTDYSHTKIGLNLSEQFVEANSKNSYRRADNILMEGEQLTIDGDMKASKSLNINMSKDLRQEGGTIEAPTANLFVSNLEQAGGTINLEDARVRINHVHEMKPGANYQQGKGGYEGEFLEQYPNTTCSIGELGHSEVEISRYINNQANSKLTIENAAVKTNSTKTDGELIIKNDVLDSKFAVYANDFKSERSKIETNEFEIDKHSHLDKTKALVLYTTTVKQGASLLITESNIKTENFITDGSTTVDKSQVEVNEELYIGEKGSYHNIKQSITQAKTLTIKNEYESKNSVTKINEEIVVEEKGNYKSSEKDYTQANSIDNKGTLTVDDSIQVIGTLNNYESGTLGIVNQAYVETGDLVNDGGLSVYHSHLRALKRFTNNLGSALSMYQSSVYVHNLASFGAMDISANSHLMSIQATFHPSSMTTIRESLLESVYLNFAGKTYFYNSDIYADFISLSNTAYNEVTKANFRASHNLDNASSFNIKDELHLSAGNSLNLFGTSHLSGAGNVYLEAGHGHIGGTIATKDLYINYDHLPDAGDILANPNIHPTHLLALFTNSPLTINREVKRPIDLLISASSIHINQNVNSSQSLGFTATEGDIHANAHLYGKEGLNFSAKGNLHTGKYTFISENEVVFEAGNSYFNHQGEVYGNNIYLAADSGDITNFAGKFQAKTYLQASAGGNIYNIPLEENVGGAFDVMRRWTSAQFLGGTGEGHYGIGLALYSGKKIVNDASILGAKGSTFISAHEGFESLARSHFYKCFEHTKRKWHGGKKTTASYDTQIQEAYVFSEHGSNTIIADAGDIHSIGTQFIAKNGNDLIAKGNVKLFYLKGRQETFVNKKGAFGLSRSKYFEGHDTATPTVIANLIPGDIRIHAQADVIGHGFIIYNLGKTQIHGENVYLSIPILNHEVRKHTQGIRLKIGGITIIGDRPANQSLLTSDSTLEHTKRLFNSNGAGEFGLNLLSSGIDMVNTINTFSNALQNGGIISALAERYGLGFLFNPKLSIERYESKSQLRYQTPGPGNIYTGDLEIIAKNRARIEGLPIHVVKDMRVKAKDFQLIGTKLHHSYKQTHNSVSVSPSANPAGVDVAVAMGRLKSSGTYTYFQNTHVGGTLTVEADKWLIQDAIALAKSLKGKVDTLEIRTTVDKFKSHNESYHAATTGQFGLQQGSTHKTFIAETAKLMVMDTINDDFKVVTVILEAGKIISQDKNNLNADKVITGSVITSKSSHQINVSGNVMDFPLMPEKDQNNSNSFLIPTMNINYSTSHSEQEQQGVIYGQKGTHLNVKYIIGNLHTSNTDGSFTLINESHNYMAEIPLDKKFSYKFKRAWQHLTDYEATAAQANWKMKNKQEEIKQKIQKITSTDSIKEAGQITNVGYESSEGVYEHDLGAKRLKLQGYQIAQSFEVKETDARVAVYVNPLERKCFIGISGSRTILAWVTDNIDTVLGREPRSVAKIHENLKETIALYQQKGYSIYLTGHSRGAGVATALSSMYKVPAITFDNPGLNNRSKQYDTSRVLSFQSTPNIINNSEGLTFRKNDKGAVINLSATTKDELINLTLETISKVASTKFSDLLSFFIHTERSHSNEQIEKRFKDFESTIKNSM